jgi:histone H3/H4
MLRASEWAADMRRITREEIGMTPNAPATHEQMIQLQASCRRVFESRTGLSWSATRDANKGFGQAEGSCTRFLAGDHSLWARGTDQAFAIEGNEAAHEPAMSAIREAGSVTDALPGSEDVTDSVPFLWVLWRETVAEDSDVWLPPQMSASVPQLLVPFDPETSRLRNGRVLAAGVAYAAGEPTFYLPKPMMNRLREKFRFKCAVVKAFLDAGRPTVIYRPKPLCATAPAQPAQPTGPAQPTAPAQPTGPAQPAQPVRVAGVVAPRSMGKSSRRRRKVWYPEERAKRQRDAAPREARESSLDLDLPRAPFESIVRELGGDYRWESNALRLLQYATEQRLVDLFDDAYFIAEKVGKRVTLMEVDMRVARRVNRSEI